MGSHFMAIAFLLLGSTTASALEVYMQAEGVHLRVAGLKDHSAYNYDYLTREQKLKNSTFYIPRGAKLNIPDEFVVRSSDGQPDLKKSIDKWYHIEQQAVRDLRLNDNGSAVKSEDRRTDAIGHFMAVSTENLNALNPELDLPKKYPTAYIDFKKILYDNPQALSLKPVASLPQATRTEGRPASVSKISSVTAPTGSRIQPIQFRHFDRPAQHSQTQSQVVASEVRSESPKAQSPVKIQNVATQSPKSLICSKDGEDQCKDVHYDLANIPRDYFTRGFCKQKHCDSNARVRAFAEYMAPIAQYFQAKTGFPASVMIAQAMLETGYGTSFLFNRKEALFGESCTRYGAQVIREYAIGDTNFVSKGSCVTSRPVNEGYYYVSFDSKESSVASYVHNLLIDKRTERTYPGVRQEVAKTRSADANGVTSWQKILPHLRRYATNPNYTSELSGTIRRFGLDKYDKNSCQTCIEQRENNQRANNHEKATI